ncbi:hypothetical protein FS749_013757 [Ceratobasidium sp. UAMH 11750]|nr:hypothetical protein FS749_013757 [Ceratobasidium sp. UAMH 11750]
MEKLPHIATLPEPQSDNDSADAETPRVTQISSPAKPTPLEVPVIATQLGSFNFIIPSRLSPLPPTPLRKRRKSSLSSVRVTKAQRTNSRASAVDALNTSQIPELETSDELPEPSQIFSTPPVSHKSKGKQPLRSPQHSPMSGGGIGRLSDFFNRPKILNPPRKSAPAKLEYETIVLDSSDDEATEPVVTTSQAHSSQSLPAPRDPDVIDISDSDSDAEPSVPPPRARPSLASSVISNKNTSLPPQESPSRALPAPSISIPTESLPPLPPSPDTEQSPVEAPSLPSGSTPLGAHEVSFDKSTHRSPHGTRPGSSSDSGSSGGMVETDVAPTGPDEPSFVLNSGGSSSSQIASPTPEDPTEELQEGRGRSTTLTSPRGRPPNHRSPSHGSLSRSGAATEAELEDIVASVSLHDSLSNPQTDKVVAQTAVAVSNIALTDESEREQGSLTDTHSAASESVSSEGTVRYKCSVEGCGSKFTAPGQLHTHMRRDHGVRLSQDTRRVRHGKRKADDTPMTPTKRHSHASRSDIRAPQASISGSGSRGSVRSSQNSDLAEEFPKTIGFEPFVRHLSDQCSSPHPESDEDMDEPIVISDSSPSPPRTPAPPVPKMRAPHPNVRPSVPDSPSAHLSPSKQLAQKKNEVVIPGEELETWRVDIVNHMPQSYRDNPGIRVVFEGFMDEAMRENEPCAPAIPVENKVDDQPCPPWEFVYCNRVLYGQNVPRPDHDALVGCDCLGPCNPNNKDCACVQKQEAWLATSDALSDYSGFAFDENGTLRFHHGAIFGCNSKCTCDLECRNKVWQQGRKHKVVLRKTKEKGWGVFAGEHIPAGAYLGVYTGELLTEGFADKRAQVYDEFGRTYILNIDFHHLSANGTGAPDYAMDAFHAGNFTRFLNHSCRPNLVLSALYVEEPDIRKPWLALFSDKDIKPGQELTFSYTGMDADDPEDQAKIAEAKRKGASGKSKRGKVFEECLCGAEGCFGIIFK